jgi:hypothetical protein
VRRLARWFAGALGVAIAAAGAAWLAGFLGPLGPIGGGRLRGEVAASTPADWSFADRVGEVQVETQWGLLPWSVTTWCLTHAGRLYLPSRNCLAKRWVQNVLANPEVRVRLEGRIYELRAVRDEDPEVGRALLEQMLVKYLGIEAEGARPAQGGDPEANAQAYGCAFRLEPRS